MLELWQGRVAKRPEQAQGHLRCPCMELDAASIAMGHRFVNLIIKSLRTL